MILPGTPRGPRGGGERGGQRQGEGAGAGARDARPACTLQGEGEGAKGAIQKETLNSTVAAPPGRAEVAAAKRDLAAPKAPQKCLRPRWPHETLGARECRAFLPTTRAARPPLSPPPQSCAFAGFAREFVDRRSAARARSEGAARAEGRVSPAASARPLFSFPKIPKDSLQNKPPAFLQLLQSRVSPGASALRTHRRPGPSSFSSCARFQQRQA